MTEEATKVYRAFDKAWSEEPNPAAHGTLDLAHRFFVLGARAFSTMPLCEHGVAVWGVEVCTACAEKVDSSVGELEAEKEAAVSRQDFELVGSLRHKIEALKAAAPGEFPGYNRPFEAALPEGMTQGDLEDLKAEHEAMRQTIFQILVKVEALDPAASSAPWDPVNLLHFVGLWLSNALPFANTSLVTALGRLQRDMQRLHAALAAHLEDHKGGAISAAEALVPCPACKGSKHADYAAVPCPACGGSGVKEGPA